MDYILKAENLTKIYGHHKALDNFSMHIPQGAIYGLVGRNGAGKTTLLRIICGLQEATFGDYSLYGISSRKHEILNARKEMGAVIETPATNLLSKFYCVCDCQCIVFAVLYRWSFCNRKHEWR